MATGYTRQSSSQIIDAEIINASDFNNEFNQLQSAFNVSTGHNHDGSTTGGGAAVNYNNLSNLPSLGTISSQNSNAINITGGTITGISTPTNSTDVATKSYVDNSFYFPLFQVGFAVGAGVFPSLNSNTLTIKPGLIFDVNNNSYKLTTSLTKSMTSSWIAGNNNGAMGTGLTVTTSTWYDVYIVKVTTTGNVDVYFETAGASPTHLPSGATNPLRIGSFYTDSNSKAIAFTQIGQYIYWTTAIIAFNTTGLGSGSTDLDLSAVGATPPHNVFPIFDNIRLTEGASAGANQVYTIFSKVNTSGASYSVVANGNSQIGAGGVTYLQTNSSGVIRHSTTNTTNTINLSCAGWLDPTLSPFAR